jgi:Arc/MetJ-type ribon-helix-helix transcriptional regulator
LVLRGLYKSRAEAIREFTREYVLAQKRDVA